VTVQDQFIWLLFRLQGRISRVPYLLAFLLVGLIQAFRSIAI
jgi:uncharacterized membrane protein YhaH (DUF805 family)